MSYPHKAHMIQFRVTKEQKEHVMTLAKDQGMSISEWMRLVIFLNTTFVEMITKRGPSPVFGDENDD